MICHKSFCILVFICTHQRLPLSCSVVTALPLRTPATFALQSIYNMIGKGNTNKKYNHLQPNEPRTCSYFAVIFFIFIEQQWLLFCDWHPYHAVHYRTTIAGMSCATCIACDTPSLLFTSLDRIICLIMFVIPASAASFAAGSQTL